MAGLEATTDPLRLTRQLYHILKNNFLALIFHETHTLKPLFPSSPSPSCRSLAPPTRSSDSRTLPSQRPAPKISIAIFLHSPGNQVRLVGARSCDGSEVDAAMASQILFEVLDSQFPVIFGGAGGTWLSGRRSGTFLDKRWDFLGSRRDLSDRRRKWLDNGWRLLD
jgi:hypothetical protein